MTPRSRLAVRSIEDQSPTTIDDRRARGWGAPALTVMVPHAAVVAAMPSAIVITTIVQPDCDEAGAARTASSRAIASIRQLSMKLHASWRAGCGIDAKPLVAQAVCQHGGNDQHGDRGGANVTGSCADTAHDESSARDGRCRPEQSNRDSDPHRTHPRFNIMKGLRVPVPRGLP